MANHISSPADTAYYSPRIKRTVKAILTAVDPTLHSEYAPGIEAFLGLLVNEVVGHERGEVPDSWFENNIDEPAEIV